MVRCYYAHLLLDAGAPHHQLADELHQTRAQAGIFVGAGSCHSCAALTGSCDSCLLGHGVVQLREEGEEDLDPADGVQGGVDGPRHHCRHVLEKRDEFGTRQRTSLYIKLHVCVCVPVLPLVTKC